MKNAILFLVISFSIAITACEEESKPLSARIVYTVNYEAQSQEITMDTANVPPPTGYCNIAKSGNDTYPYRLTFNFYIGTPTNANTYHSLSGSGIMMRAGLSPDAVPCDNLKIDFKAVKQENPAGVACGDPAEGKCKFSGISYDEKQNVASGSFECGEFPTNTGTTMSIPRGSFTFTNCTKR